VVVVPPAPSWASHASWALLQAPAPRALFLLDLILDFLDASSARALFPDLIRRSDLFPARHPPLLNPLNAAWELPAFNLFFH
jgi:hypothetical protein